jgi:YVTN family beta-propeller protein
VATKKEAAKINVQYEKFSTQGSQAARLQLTADGKRAFMLHRPTQELIVFDTAARKEIKRFKLPGAGALVIAPDSSRVYIAMRGENYIAVIDAQSLQQTGKIDVAGGPNAMAWLAGK